MAHILVVTNSLDDLHVKAVQQHIEQMSCTLIRIDVDRIIQGKHTIFWDFQGRGITLKTEERYISLCDVESVWYRKPFGFGSTHGFVESIVDPVQQAMVAKEVHDLIDGLFAVLQDRFWLNRPQAINQARLKPYQLHLARAIGLPMADTIITNDPDLARAFCQQGPTIFKPLAESALKYDDQSYVVETTLLTDEHKQRLDLIRSQPILLQRYIEKSAELRVTCVGSDILVAKQILRDDRSATHVTDWRSLQGTEESSYTPASLPSAIIPKVKELLAKLDLGFAALDFAVDQEDKVYFLEVNPNGQWLGYTDKIGLPAAQKIARCLVFKTKQPYK